MVINNISQGMDNMLTASELANLLNVHINTVRRWSDSGLLQSYRIGPRGDRRFRKGDIDLFLESNLHGTDTPPHRS
jgi:excisionase family DNA binding protein